MDDEFGELYADVEVQANSAINGTADFAEPKEDDVKKTKKENNASLKEGFDNIKKSNSVCGDSEDSGSEGSEVSSRKEVGDVGSDSDDDLNIVLNDEDCKVFLNVGGGVVRNGGAVAGNDYDDDVNDFVSKEGNDSGKNRKCGDQLPDGLEPMSSYGHGGESKNGVKGAYSSQYSQNKCTRAHRSTYTNNLSANMSVGMPSYSSMLTKGGWDNNAHNHHKVSSSHQFAYTGAAVNPTVAKSRYGFLRPWHRTILNVNIDTLREKPWRNPGLDITDFFNFGFNEQTWKEYCGALEQFWRSSMHTGVPATEASQRIQAGEDGFGNRKLSQEGFNNQIGQVVSLTVTSPSEFVDGSLRKLDVPKGRAIEVEDSTGERQPSMDVKCARTIDSDVIIQIEVQDSSEECSGSGNSNTHEASEKGVLNAGGNKKFPCSGTTDYELLEDFSEADVTKLEKASFENRYPQLKTTHSRMNLDSDSHRNDQISGSLPEEYYNGTKDIEEAPKAKLKPEEEIGRDTCSAKPCVMESELSLGDQGYLSLSPSCFDNDSEVSINEIHSNSEKSYSPLSRPSGNSGIELKDSAVSYEETLIKSDVHRQQGNIDNYSRNRGPIRQREKHWSSSLNRAELQKHTENEDDTDAFTILNAEDLPHRHAYGNYDRRKGRRQDFGSHNRRDRSYYKEAGEPNHFGDEKNVGNLAQKSYNKYRYREGCYKENKNPYVRRNWNRREYFCERRIPTVDNEDGDGDWHYAARECPVNDMIPLSYRRSRQYVSKCSSSILKERDARWRRKHGEPHFKEITSHKDHRFEERKNDFVFEKYGKSTSLTGGGRDSLDKYKRQFPYIGNGMNRCQRMDQGYDSPHLDGDGLWSGEMEDDYQKDMVNQISGSQFYRQSYSADKRNWHDTVSPRNDAFDTRLNNNYGEYKRRKYGGDCRGSGFHLDGDSLWSGEMEDDYQKDMVHQISDSQIYSQSYSADKRNWQDTVSPRNDVYDTRLNNNCEEYKRRKYSGKGRDFDLFRCYDCAIDNEDCIIHPDDDYRSRGRRLSYQSEILHWTEDEVILMHEDELHAEEASYSHEKTSRHERIQERYIPMHDEMHTDDIELEQHRLKMTSGGSDDFVSRSTNIICRGKRERAVLRPRNSVDLVVGKGKSSGRCSKVRSFMCKGRIENLDLTKKQTTSMCCDEYGKKSFEHGISKTQIDPNKTIWLGKFSVKEAKDALDIEEGQIVTEEPNVEKSVSGTDVSGGVAPTHTVMKRMLQNENGSDQIQNGTDSGYDSQHIRETLAKMEKRRERFKESITTKKETGASSMPHIDVAVDTDQIKQHRPARKRRWGGG
ncbi:FIP1 [Quillaja saponaria]|uniref:FIP1 n=1 Tax=Quillaja saponaria TaxID=32244 RepID=A0AAD7LD63_QUISA|nr:FIP1 [Quillaja saponaria]